MRAGGPWRVLRRLVLPHRQRVFGIGLSKTGTTSLASALNQLGIRTLHYPSDARTYTELQRGEPRLSVLEAFDGITDLPAVMLYPKLARVFPMARFVLTVRDESSWLRSMRHHWQRFPPRPPGAESDHRYALRRLIHSAVYGGDAFDAEKLARRRSDYRREVEAFFADEPDRLLVLDICAGEGWEKLCPFLGKRVPRRKFPWDYPTYYSVPPMPAT